ncbi:MAG: acyl-CoA thioesterase [Haloarculaceae archaeon]
MSEESEPPDYHDVFENRVRFAETDAQGIVFYGEYLTFMDEAFSAFVEAVGYPYGSFEERGWDIHVVNVDIDYHASAEFADELVNGMRVSAIRHSSIEFDWVCRHRDGGHVASGGVTHVAVDGDGETVRVPDGFREAVVEFQEVPPDPV